MAYVRKNIDRGTGPMASIKRRNTYKFYVYTFIFEITYLLFAVPFNCMGYRASYSA